MNRKYNKNDNTYWDVYKNIQSIIFSFTFSVIFNKFIYNFIFTTRSFLINLDYLQIQFEKSFPHIEVKLII